MSSVIGGADALVRPAAKPPLQRGEKSGLAAAASRVPRYSTFDPAAYSSSLTFSIQSTVLPSRRSTMAMWSWPWLRSRHAVLLAWRAPDDVTRPDLLDRA